MQSNDEAEESKNEESEGIFPDYEPILQEFESMIVWKSYKGKKIPEPKQGVSEELDRANAIVDEIKSRIHDYIDVVAKETGCNSIELFQSHGKFRYQLELPKEFTRLDEDEYIKTGSTTTKTRYVTQRLQEITEELEAQEDDIKNALVPFLRGMFKRFYEHRAIFSNATSCVAELDCISALADVSADNSNGRMCKPEILER